MNLILIDMNCFDLLVGMGVDFTLSILKRQE